MAGCTGAARLIALFFLVLAVGSRREGNLIRDPQTEQFRKQGFTLLMSGRYPEAARFYAARAQEAERKGQLSSAAVYRNNLGSSYLSFYQFTQALEAFARSRELAIESGNYEVQAGATANMSSLYLQNNDIEKAGALIETVLPVLNRLSDEHNRAGIQLQLATVRMEQRRTAEGKVALASAIEHSLRAVGSALRRRNRSELVRGWAAFASAHDRVGLVCMMESDWDAAELHFTEAFRIRSLFRLGERAHSCLHLGQLYQARGDLDGALRLLNRAVELARVEPLSSVWRIRIGRGRVRAALGDGTGALDDYREALRIARRFRLGVLPTDSTRVLTDVRLDQAYDEFVETAARLSRVQHRPELAREALQVVEESRAASLWALLRESGNTKRSMPPQYGEMLSRFQAAESRLLSADTPENRRQASLLETALLEIEARSGYNRPVNTAGLVEHIQTRMPADCALLSFHLGKAESYVWAITNLDFRLYSLPNADRIKERIKLFSQAIHQESRTSEQAGRALYDMLLGNLGSAFHRKKRWLLALDEDLFEVPFSALPVLDAGKGDRYLVEQHSLQVIPGALFLEPGQSTSGEGCRTRFLGVGDAIYNTADPRWTRKGAPPNLPRLVASGEEIDVCSRAWGEANPILLKGASATKPGLEKALATRPAVVHLAAHVVQAEGGQRREQPNPRVAAGPDMSERWRERLIRVVLSPTETPGSEYLGPEEIRKWRLEATLVTIDGCTSGGRAVPGAGLLGLTRPWLAAGAQAVAATRWPVADEKGRLWASMYRLLKQKDSDPAVALQLAQIDMIRSGGRHAKPAYWAAYFLVGKQWPPHAPMARRGRQNSR